MKRTTLSTVRTAIVLGVIAIALGLAQVNAQNTIYSHSFGGSGGQLDGVVVDVGGQTWQAGSVFMDNGQVDTLVAGSPNGQAAFLPLTVYDNVVYTATATILNQNPNWIAFGFMPANPSTAGLTWTSTSSGVRHSNNGAYAWGLDRNNPSANNQEFFNGPNTSNGTGIAGDIVDATQPVTVSIVLDTTAPTWTAQYFLNGVQQGGTFSLASTANAAIGGIGFSRDRNSTANAGGIISEFSLAAIPESSPLVLLGLGGLLLAALCRRD